MPEGDSVAGDARRLRPVLVGRRLLAVAGTSPEVRAASGRILDADVDRIRTIGKNLVIDLATGYSIRVHRGMTGYWSISTLDVAPHGSARLALTTEEHHVACFDMPTVAVDRTPAVTAALRALGPDVLGDFDEREFLRRARLFPDSTISELLLDQRVIAGIGNVYRSELLFLERVHPETSVHDLGDQKLGKIADRARLLMAANVGRGPRTTTGARGRGSEMWVYGRAGRACRRCGTAIAQRRLGSRVVYWCPSCQGA